MEAAGRAEAWGDLESGRQRVPAAMANTGQGCQTSGHFKGNSEAEFLNK